MTCFFCKSEMTEGMTIHAMQLKSCIAVVKNVPCHVCNHCGATVVSLPVAKKLEEIAKGCESVVAESKVIDYSAA